MKNLFFNLTSLLLIFNSKILFVNTQTSSCNCERIFSGIIRTSYSPTSTHMMITGTGGRVVRRYIKFPKPYTTKAHFKVAVYSLDAGKNENVRIHCWPSHRSLLGFYMNIGTWGDTKIYSASCSWMTHGL